MDDPIQQPGSESSPSTSATALLISRARDGDVDAREQLFARFLPVLREWAHRRLPVNARDLNETADLVQITLLRALNHLERFESRGEGAFLAYLRAILLNLVRQEIRRTQRRGVHESLHDTLVSPYASVVERAIGAEHLERYQRALANLSEEKQHAVLLRIEFGYSYAQIAEALDKPSADAARMTVVRALEELADAMDRNGKRPAL